MNEITFPIAPRMQGPAVADLQNALQAFLKGSLGSRRGERDSGGM